MSDKYRKYDEYDNGHELYGQQNVVDSSGRPGGYDNEDVFGHEEGHAVRRIDIENFPAK